MRLVWTASFGAKGGEATRTRGAVEYPEPGLVMVKPITTPLETTAVAVAPEPAPNPCLNENDRGDPHSHSRRP